MRCKSITYSLFALLLMLATCARADIAPILNVFRSGGNPVEGTAYTFTVSVQLDLNARGLQKVQSGFVDFGNGGGQSYAIANGQFLNYFTANLSFPQTYFTAGTYNGTVSGTVYWVNSSGANQVTNVSTPVTIYVDNVAPTFSVIGCTFTQVDGLGNPIANPHVPRGVPCTFYGTGSDPGATTLTASWTLDEDGQYDDAIYSQSNQSGFFPTATKAFYNLGNRFVRYKVTDAEGANPSPVTFPFVVDFQQPDATTGSATAISAHGATLSGTMNLKSMVDCVAVFEYGTDTSYGSSVEMALNPTDTSAAKAVTGLAAETTYHFRFSVRDGGGLVAYGSDGTFTTGANTPPVGHSDVGVSNGQGLTTIDVLANDTDEDGDPLSITSVTNGLHGSAAIQSGKIVYTPNSTFKGTDTFTYIANDGRADSAATTVTITSNKGTYSALVSLPAGSMSVREGSLTPPANPPTYTGVLSFKLAFDNQFTGKLTLGAKSYPIKGSFDATGHVQIVIDRKDPDPDLTLVLDLDLSDPSAPAPAVTGTVSDGTNTYDIDGSRATDPKTFPAAVIAKYTVVIGVPTDTTLPQGYGFGVLTVKKGGSATLIGKRNDGVPFSLSAKASDGANWMFIKGFTPNPKGNVAAQISVVDDGANDLHGTFNWNKAASTKGLYQQAFNVQLGVVGSRYLKPAKTANALLFTATPPATAAALTTLTDVDGTALAFSPLSVNFSLADVITATTTGADLFAGKIVKPSGALSGSFIHPTAAKVKFTGTTLQRQNFAAGLFITPTGTGSIKIDPQ